MFRRPLAGMGNAVSNLKSKSVPEKYLRDRKVDLGASQRMEVMDSYYNG